MKVNNRVKIILIALLVFVMMISYLTNRFVGKSDQRYKQPEKMDSLHYSNQEKVDSYSQAKREEAQKRQKLNQEKTNSDEKPTQLTIDGWDPATQRTIDPINLWKNYESRTYSGKVRHGEKVTFIKRDGDGVLIETNSGLQGWVTYFFIKEFKD